MNDAHLELSLSGRLDSAHAPDIWNEIEHLIKQHHIKQLTIQAQNLTYCDLTGIALFLHYQQRFKEQFTLNNLSENDTKLLERFTEEVSTPVPPPTQKKGSLPEDVGRGTMQIIQHINSFIEFTGESTAAFAQIIRHPKKARPAEIAHLVEVAGVNAFPIVALIGFLLGLILAFQAAIPLNMFGAGIFVANLVSLSLVRELGPLITAIIYAGRSGSSFAAELGTMKVNDEVNALITMGINPVSFLAIPRILASILVMPLLTAFAMLCGIIGAAPVLISMGYPLTTYIDRVQSSISAGDLIGGLFKSIIFGLIISTVGCQQGLQTKAGSQAVGESTTRSVVHSIVYIAVADGLFAVLFYILGF